MRIFIATLLFLFASVCNADERPNVLVILCDDIGAHELSLYGHPKHKTPTLDELGRTGIWFTTGYATPICHPTRFCIMTGQYGHHNGVYHFPGRPGGPPKNAGPDDISSHLTFGKLFQQAGYATAQAGKWQLSGEHPTLINECGFDEYCMWAYKHNLPAGVKHDGAWEGKAGSKTCRYWHPSVVQNGKYLDTDDDSYGPDIYSDFILDFVGRTGDKPFLVYFPMALTHGQFFSTPDTTKTKEDRFKHDKKKNWQANVEYTDKIMGKLVAGLEKLGKRRNTLIIFVGDNGTGGDGKGKTTERGCRVPFIVNGPGIVKPMGESRELVDISDVVPTICEVAGIELPQDHVIDGVSFAPYLRGETKPLREWIYAYLGDKRVVRTKRWLLENNSMNEFGQLYDCGDSRDGTGYRDVTLAEDEATEKAKLMMNKILADKPVPVAADKKEKMIESICDLNRTTILAAIAALFAAGCPGLTSADAAEGRKPNILVFLVDDLGPDELVCYASKFHETPNIDALAARGMRFTHAYSGATLCSPSRAAILTGRSPARLHLTDWIPGQPQINRKTVTPNWQTWIDRERVLLPEAMKEQGYATCFLGKWHLVPRLKPTERKDQKRAAELAAIYQEHMPENNGFDDNFGGDHSANQGKRFLYPAFRRFPRLEDKGDESDCLTDVLTNCAVDFLERKKHEPFFLFFSYYTVHSPITGKPEYVKKYERKLADNPDAGYYMNSPGKAAMIQSLDESVGRVIAKLKEIGQLDNTLIIFTGDNGSQGDEFVVNFRGNKGTAYEGGVRVPLIVAGPRIQTGICEVPTIGMDLYPTILSYIEAPPKPREHLDGVNIMPVLTGSGTIKDRPLYWHYPHYDETTPYSSAIVDGWKVVRYADDGKIEIYNLNNDPMEKADLAATHPEKAEFLVKSLNEYLTKVNAQLAWPNPDYDPDPNKYSGGIRGLKAWEKSRQNKQ